MPYVTNQRQLQTIPGDLTTVVAKSEPWSRQTAAQIALARSMYDEGPQLATDLARIGFYTADVAIFIKERKQVLVGITGRDGFNIIYGQETKEVTDELTREGFYHVKGEKAAGINMLLGSQVTFVPIKELKLENEGTYGCITIRTENFIKDSTPAREPFVRAVFGEGLVRKQVMAYLADNPIKKIHETRIYLPAPEVVEEALAKTEKGEMIGRACWLSSFGNDSIFFAVDRFVGNRGALRGVPIKDAEGVRQ
ncbi:MAG: hypothetical protein ABIF10_04765 [Candidatus Woesearchaeota archaeon]